jgi:hypothetical protein
MRRDIIATQYVRLEFTKSEISISATNPKGRRKSGLNYTRKPLDCKITTNEQIKV